ncbi:MAG: polysaccharide deacetylase family protein [Bacteroidia bacterium]|nr:polysaccharide deacetylase family protein [Bacteroidia bacterium]MCF8427230.1 polysaccharide deacetylase family protein [Bacteroidia bacterium]
MYLNRKANSYKIFLFAILIGFTFSNCKKDNSKPLGAGILITVDKPPDTWQHLQTFLKENDVKLTFYIENYNTITDSTKEMMKSFMKDGHEIAHHSLTHAHADEYAEKYGVDAYLQDEILNVTEAMKKDGFNPVTFAYPHGDCTSEVDQALLKHFVNIRKIIAPYLNKKLCDLDQIYLRQGNVKVFFGAGIDTRYHLELEDIFKALEKAKNSRQTISLYTHFLSKDGKPLEGSDSHIAQEDFIKIIQKAKELGLKFYTAKEVGAN